jgi:hypothetical protein
MIYKKRNIKKMVQAMSQKKNNLFNKGKNSNNKKKT